MQGWGRLNDRQVMLLRRIADGDDLSAPEGVSYRISVRALQSRGLIRVSRKGGAWRATVTDVGRLYLVPGR